MVPVIILQPVLPIIHEWFPMIRTHFFSIQVFNKTSDCCPPCYSSWNVHYYTGANIFFICCIVNVVLIGELLHHHVPICFITKSIGTIPIFCLISFIYVVNKEIIPNIISKVGVIQPFLYFFIKLFNPPFHV